MPLQTKGVISFLALAFGLAWISWEIPIRMGVPAYSPAFQPYALAGGFAPAIAAIIVRKWITREGFGDAGLRLRIVRGWPYYLFGWLLPLFVVGAIAAQAVIYGIAQPDFSLARVAATHDTGAYAALANTGLSAIPKLMAMSVLMTPILWGEEFGFRGYLQTRLLPGRTVLGGAATGLIWAVWHYPVTLRGYDYPDHPILGTVMFTLMAIMVSIVFGWVHARSGSIWTSSLAHAATNSIGALAVLWFAGAADPTLTSYGGALALPPLLAVCVWIARRDRNDCDAALSRRRR